MPREITTSDFKTLMYLLDIIKNRQNIRKEINDLNLSAIEAKLVINDEENPSNNQSSLIILYFKSSQLKEDILLKGFIRLNIDISNFNELSFKEDDYSYIGSKLHYDFSSIMNYLKKIDHPILEEMKRHPLINDKKLIKKFMDQFSKQNGKSN